jgi:hypothetical protein
MTARTEWRRFTVGIRTCYGHVLPAAQRSARSGSIPLLDNSSKCRLAPEPGNDSGWIDA